MSDQSESVAYHSRQAEHYNRDSEIIRGSRENHGAYLRDTLAFLEPQPRRFLDLGCGTGYFTMIMAEALPEANGLAIDGSSAMLEQAKQAIKAHTGRVGLRQCMFSDLPWEDLGVFDLVFSGFAIHHLVDSDKDALYRQIASAVSPSGCFVLFDSFRPRGNRADTLLEHLSCVDIQRRYQGRTGKHVEIARVIETDRRKKGEQGDKEATLLDTLASLRRVGLSDACVIFAESRLVGLAAFTG